MLVEGIVIIGAGFSGLATAHSLYEKGIPATVYEARDRIGGRVQSIYITGRVAEVGGQNISDGGNAPHFHALIKKFGLKTQSESFYNPFFGTLDMDLKTFRNHAKGCQTMQDFLDKIDVPDGALLLSAIEGLDPTLLSIECLPTLESIYFSEPETYFESVVGGNVQVAERMARDLKVHLNSPLRAVRKEGERYLLEFDRHKVLAEQLVLTLPTTMYSTIDFAEDVLPKKRVEAISSIAFGTNAKVLIPIDGVKGKSTFTNNGRVGTFTTVDKGVLTLYYTRKFGDFDEKTVEEVYALDQPHAENYFDLASNLPPEMIRDTNFSEYAGPAAKSWPNDPYTKGSYSATGAGQEALYTELVMYKGHPVKKVFEPYEKVYFAGEATSTLLEIDGTMEAALESGFKAANILSSN